MKVLMFGWEFPPHISGGLGTACYGLTKGMSHIPGLEILFLVPKAVGDEDQRMIRLLGANEVEIGKTKVDFKGMLERISYIEVNSNIIPYTDPEQHSPVVIAGQPKANLCINSYFPRK